MSKYNKSVSYALVAALLSTTVMPTFIMAKENDVVGKETASLKLAQGDFILETSASLSFGSHKIGNEKKVVSTGFEKDFFVTDARGTQEGWNLTVSATNFSIVEPTGGWIQENPYSLPMGSLSLERLRLIQGVYGEKKELHPNASSLGVVIDLGQEVDVSHAALGKGMGKYKLTFPTDALKLVIDPATAKIDRINYPNGVTPYEATIYWNLVAGPSSNGGSSGSGTTPPPKFEDDGVPTLEGGKPIGEGGTNDQSNIEISIEKELGTFLYRTEKNHDTNTTTATVTGYTGTNTNVVIPNTIDGFKVSKINKGAFLTKTEKINDVTGKGNVKIDTVVIPNTVSVIEEYAFANNRLTSITLPNDLIRIGNGAFVNNKITSLVLPNNVKSVGNSAFENNLITSLSYNKNVDIIFGDRAFANNKLGNVQYDENLVDVGENVFYGNRN